MQHLSMIVWNEELKNDTLLNIKDVLFKEEYEIRFFSPPSLVL